MTFHSATRASKYTTRTFSEGIDASVREVCIVRVVASWGPMTAGKSDALDAWKDGKAIKIMR